MTTVALETSLGSIKLELDDQATPETTQNFLQYVNSGFYNGTIFHRVIKGFMIQGGGFEPELKSKNPTGTLKNEARTGLKNEIGTIAMARTSAPHSASSQFFINVANNTFLNYKSETPEGYGYCVFGKVIEGMDVVNKISQVSTTHQRGHDDVPVESVVILRAEQLS